MQQFNPDEVSESPIDIKEYFYLFWSWSWLIVLAGLLAGGAAFLVSIHTTPIYQASTRLLVSTPSTSINGVDPTALVATQTMTQTYSQMLLDPPVLQGVIDQLKLQTTTDELAKSISVDVVPNTQLLSITVQDPSPARAAEIANAMASVFANRIRGLQSQRYADSRNGLEKQINDIQQQITTTNNQINVTTDPSTLQQLQARATQYRTIYANLVTTLEQVSLAEEQTSTNVVVSAQATPPTIPVSPKTTRNTLLAILAGMLLAAAAVFAVDALDDTIKNPDEIRRKFNIPILGMIGWHHSADGKPISLSEPRSPTAEAFRSLRTNITFAGVDTSLRRIMVTSPTPKDGKTTIATNLAVVLAQGEKKVALIDADLRRPTIHSKFGIHNRIGLTDLFVKSFKSFDSVIQFNSVSSLGLITSGPLPPNPAELLTSHMMTRILDQLNKSYDVVVIDTPPVLAVTDSSALAPSVDGVIMVVKPGTTKLTALHQALDQLHSVGARVLGVVLNNVSPSSRKYGYYYKEYSSRYSHYYEEKGGTKKAKVKETAKRKPVPEKLPQAVADKTSPALKTKNW